MRDYGEDGLAIYEDGTKETQEEHNRLLEEEAARQGKDGERDTARMRQTDMQTDTHTARERERERERQRNRDGEREERLRLPSFLVV